MPGISIHQNGKTFADLKSGLQDHILRENDKDGERISHYTDSYIDTTQTKFNQTIFLNDNEIERDEKGKIKFVSRIRNEFSEMNVKRKSEGLRAKQKNANIGSVDTLQLSDDVLEAMGYEKFYKDRFDLDDEGREIAVRKPWSEQTEETRRLVVQAYRAMVEATNDRPDLYGITVLAQLHVDESTPHVERVSRMVDKDDYDFNASNIINGNHLGKGRRGKKYFEHRQDHFAEKTRELLGEEFSNRYRVKRGEKGSKTADKTKNLDLYEAALKIKAKQQEEFDNDTFAMRVNMYSELREEDKKIRAEREKDFKEREEALRASESDFNNKWDDLSRWENELRERDENTLKLDDINNKIETANKTLSELNTAISEKEEYKATLTKENDVKTAENAKLSDVMKEAKTKFLNTTELSKIALNSFDDMMLNFALKYADIKVAENSKTVTKTFLEFYCDKKEQLTKSKAENALREAYQNAGLNYDDKQSNEPKYNGPSY